MPSSHHTRSRGLGSIVAAVALTASTAGAIGGGAVTVVGTGATTGAVVGTGTGALPCFGIVMANVKQYLVYKFLRVRKSVIQAVKLLTTVVCDRRAIFAP